MNPRMQRIEQTFFRDFHKKTEFTDRLSALLQPMKTNKLVKIVSVFLLKKKLMPCNKGLRYRKPMLILQINIKVKREFLINKA